MDIAAYHKLLRPAAQLVQVTTEYITVMGSALAVTTQSVVISLAQGMRAITNIGDLLLLAGLRERPGWQ